MLDELETRSDATGVAAVEHKHLRVDGSARLDFGGIEIDPYPQGATAKGT